jgi:hypothetical protein
MVATPTNQNELNLALLLHDCTIPLWKHCYRENGDASMQWKRELLREGRTAMNQVVSSLKNTAKE